jgi:antitoxin MazE
MVTKIKKWGNSLAIRIPKVAVKEMKIREGIQVDFNFDENKITITPKKKKKEKRKYTLEELVSKITPENRYEEIDFGPPLGKEIL